MDKDVFKAVLRDRGVPVTENITLRLGDEPRNPFGYPVFVKPARLGSSVGITKAHDDDELRRGVALAFEHDEKVLVEHFVSGIEVEVGVLGNQKPIASLPGEIVVTHNEWYDFEAKYDEGEMDLIVPARVTDEQILRAQELAVSAFVATDCEGMARADLFVRDDGEVLVNELNTIPGFTSTSVYARLFDASGIGYAELLQRLADLAVERFERRSAAPLFELVAAARAAEPGARTARPKPSPRCSARTPPEGPSTTTCRSRSGGSCTTSSPRATCCTGRTSTGRRVPHARELRRAQHVPRRRGLRDRRRDLAALLRRRQTPVAQSYINWCEHVPGASRYLFSIGSDPRDAALVDDRDDLRPAA